MTRYILSFADSIKHQPQHPERTAKKNAGNFDVVYQVWPNRKAMARSIRMQERGATPNQWRACVRLNDIEGY